jgi:predicted Zn-dependent protease
MSWLRSIMSRRAPLEAAGAGAFYPARGARRALRGALLASTLAVLTGCQSFTNLNTFTPAQDVELGRQAYGEILAGEKLVTSGSDLQMVRRLADRLVAAAHEERPDLVELFEWEVQLIDSPEVVNAFALPGGKMAVYSGIIPVAQTEAGLAVVMGHEIAHATERHGTEAMTRQVGIGTLIAVVLGDANAQQLANVVANLGQLKFGRDAELEADRMGLRYMARAGYDPREAAEFWRRMAALGGGAPPEWLSTHPSNENRIERIESLLPEAVQLYEASLKGQ